jgi:predicted Zn-dependent protease
MVENKGSDRLNIPQVLDNATRAQWEVFIQHSKRTDLQLRGKQREASIRQENTGYGVRVIIPRSDGGGVGFASCNSEDALEAAARTAHDLAKQNRSPFFELPAKRKLPTVKTIDKRILENKDKVAKEYAETAQSLISSEKDISLTFGKVRAYVVENQILNSRGLSYKSTGTHLYVEMTLKVGRGSNVTEFWPTRHACRIADLAPDKTIPEWLEIAKSSLKRHPPKTKQTTVIFAPNVVCDTFLPTIGFHASAEAVKQNLSRFKKGEKIASDHLTIADDGLYPYGLRTNPFDDEGQPQQKTTIIEKGTFKNHIYDQLHAQTMGSMSTGNGIRSGFGADADERYQMPPENSTTNLHIRPGTQSLDELIRDVKEGLLIYHPAWLNPDEITTRFGSEIRNAQEIKNGELGDGVIGGTLTGTALDLIQSISGISDNSEVVSGSAFGCVAPYIRFENVQISGPS